MNMTKLTVVPIPSIPVLFESRDLKLKYILCMSQSKSRSVVSQAHD